MLETSFLDMMLSNGFHPGRVIADCSYHRFDVHKKGDRCGYYNLDPQGFGVFGDWKNGAQFKFRDNKIEKMTEQEKLEIDRRMKEEYRRQNELKANRQAQAAAKAVELLAISKPAPENHTYLVRKRILPHIAKIGSDGRLIVPILDGSKTVNLQFIAPDGGKRFLTGGKKGGCYALIPGDKRCIFIVEGFATGATVHEATGCETVIALDAGNLEKVAPRVRKRYGEGTPICFAADNDHSSETNVGLEKARDAAALIGAAVTFPEGIEGTDWNDAASEGVDVRTLLTPPTDEDSEPTTIPLAECDFELNENGKPKQTKENLEALLKSKGFGVRYNVIAKREEIIVPENTFSIDNSEAAAFSCVLSECEREGLGTSHVREYLTNLCDANPFNPVAEWIASKPWDGTDRLPAFYGTIVQEGEADDPSALDLKETKLKRWMLSAIAAAFSQKNGISAHGVLVLQGRQYLGKTYWFKKLVPPELEVIKDGYILRIDDKDSLYQCLSHWIVELGELDATFKKSDIAQLKAFLTADRDILRLPYAAKKSTFPRRTVFFASVNQREFLHDETGNRRFWVIPCESINYDHGLDMQQVWAQFYAMWKGGEPYVMSPEEIELINKENEGFQSIDSIFERVSQRFDWRLFDPRYLERDESCWLTATQIALSLGIVNPNNSDSQRVSQAVKKLNGGLSKRRSGGSSAGNRDRVLLVPPVRA